MLLSPFVPLVKYQLAQVYEFDPNLVLSESSDERNMLQSFLCFYNVIPSPWMLS